MNIKTRLDGELHDAALRAAAQDGGNLADYVRHLVLQDLASRKIDSVAPTEKSAGGSGEGGDSGGME